MFIQSEENYNQIVEEFSNMIYRIAYQNLCNISDAEDIVQEVFLSLLKSREKDFTDKEHLKAWLIKVTVNKCINFRKSFWKQNTVPLEEQTLSYTDEERTVMDEVMKLPSDYRNIIYLYYYEGYTIKEIAEILGKKQNTINSKLQRGRKKLRAELEKGETYYEEKQLHKCNG